MPTDDDTQSASLLFEGEAKRLLIRRPRFDRDGLHLFGRRYAAQTVTLTVTELSALFDGRTLAVDDGEHISYLSVDGATADEVLNARPAAADANSMPRYSERVRIRAAQVRVAADRRGRVRTPDWIVQLANRAT